ncbi:MAG: NUDIX hydrolase [Flavobacteriaceae bacterium]|nr:MAG: NUDIX hydrolase [Flavobacteriaceae bacterium]
MTIKKQVYQPSKKTNPFIGLLLFFISIILIVITGSLGFIYGVFYSLFTKGFSGVGAYLLKITISIDQLGNVLMQHLLNSVWIKRNGYKFGNRDETISSALGRNNKLNTLTGFGKFIDKTLNTIERDHSLNSIDYYIEPSEQLIDKLAWIHIVDGKILSTRSKGRKKYYIPGGKRALEETDLQALFREIKEELSVVLDIPSLKFMRVFEAQADSHKPGVFVRMICYYATYQGTLIPDSEIAEVVWLNYKDLEKVSEVDRLIFDYLYKKGELL